MSDALKVYFRSCVTVNILQGYIASYMRISEKQVMHYKQDIQVLPPLPTPMFLLDSLLCPKSKMGERDVVTSRNSISRNICLETPHTHTHLPHSSSD